MAANEIFNDLNLVLQLNQHIQGVSVTSAGARVLSPAAASSPAGALAKQTSFKVLTDLESVRYSESREDAQFDHQRSIFLSVSSCDLPFHLQGDRDFNEASAMAKRRALRFSESIKTRIEFLWGVAGGKKQAEIAQRIRRQQLEDDEQGRGRRGQQSVRRAAAADGIKQLLPPLEELDEEDYMALMLLIFKVLRDDFVLELAHKQIQCDWEVDSHHGHTLTFDQFFAAMFELVDVWTCDVEEATYERFLHLLARRITRRVAVFLDGAELKLALSDNFEPEVVVKSIPLRTIPRFVSVARVVAATGMTTVGELARADPQVVERERVEFLQRNSGGVLPQEVGEIRKIGQDLQTLLAMFKSIALQFSNINYALDNNVLRKLPSAAGPRPQPAGGGGGIHSDSASQNVASGELQPDAGFAGGVSSLQNAPHAGGGATGGGSHASSPSKDDAGVRQAQPTPGNRLSSTGGSTQAEDTSLSGPLVRDGSMATAHAIESSRPSKRNASTIDCKSGLVPATTRARGASASYFQPLSTIQDLQAADAGVVNALRSTFLIEKAISIERQTAMPAIRQELVKFGVDIDVAKLPEDKVRDRYNALYDLLVLRDGESLKTLAGVMLEQIKLELGVHGIIVEAEEDIEEVYDGFFASVVTGTGDSIVQDAQRWMEGTVQGNKVNDYIQHDFHELKSVSEVKLLGTKRGDEEFLSLLAKDADVEVDAAESSGKPPGRKNSSPIQRKPSRSFAVSIPNVATPQDQQGTVPGPVEESLPHASASEHAAIHAAKDEADNAADKKRKAKKKKHGHDKAAHAAAPPAALPPESAEAARQPGGDLHGKAAPATRKPKLTISTQDSPQAGASDSEAGDGKAGLGPPIEATDNTAPDDPKGARLPLASRHGRPSTGLEIDTLPIGHHDTSDQHTARDALNIDIEFDGDEDALGALSSRLDQERCGTTYNLHGRKVLTVPVCAQGRLHGAQSAKDCNRRLFERQERASDWPLHPALGSGVGAHHESRARLFPAPAVARRTRH
jgi:hypothetical protein